jgi:hypothetical protein
LGRSRRPRRQKLTPCRLALTPVGTQALTDAPPERCHALLRHAGTAELTVKPGTVEPAASGRVPDERDGLQPMTRA